MLLRDQILSILQSEKPYFRKHFRVVKIGLFGSYARNEQQADSDVDIIIEFEDGTSELFEKKLELRAYLTEKFKRPVDLCREKAVKPVFRDLIMKDVIYA